MRRTTGPRCVDIGRAMRYGRAVKSDANIKVPREPYEEAKAFADRVGQDLRVIVGVALVEYVAREEKKAK
jgi:hypothetical protein